MAVEVTTLLAYSDCQYIRTEQEDTWLFKYSNAKDFGGLVFNAGQVYEIRAYSKFYKQRFPEENESESDSDGNVDKLSSETKTQRLLQVEPAPYHFHEALKLALQCNTVFADEEYWEKEEAYEQQELDEHFTMEKATVWLTNKFNDTYTNVYGDINEDVEE